MTKVDQLMQKVASYLLNHMASDPDKGSNDLYKSLTDLMSKELGDISKLSLDDLISLGFNKWDEDETLYLMPLWVYDIVPDGFKLKDINGDEYIKGVSEECLDTRFGYLSVGLDSDTYKFN